MVEVFKTTIENSEQAGMVKEILSELLGYSNVAFDLEDCDNVLRIESNNVNARLIIKALAILKIECQILED